MPLTTRQVRWSTSPSGTPSCWLGHGAPLDQMLGAQGGDRPTLLAHEMGVAVGASAADRLVFLGLDLPWLGALLPVLPLPGHVECLLIVGAEGMSTRGAGRIGTSGDRGKGGPAPRFLPSRLRPPCRPLRRAPPAIELTGLRLSKGLARWVGGWEAPRSCWGRSVAAFWPSKVAELVGSAGQGLIGRKASAGEA